MKLRIKKYLFVFGTRPEAVKLAPLIVEMKEQSNFDVKVCLSGQHVEMIKPVLAFFDLEADYDLGIMNSSQDLFDKTSSILVGLRDVIGKLEPNFVVVHGDTTTTLAGGLAAFYSNKELFMLKQGCAPQFAGSLS